MASARKRWLVASAAWKGCWLPNEVNTLMASILKEQDPTCDIRCVPLSDGGDGWLETVAFGIGEAPFEQHTIPVMGPIPSIAVAAAYGWAPLQRQVVLEAAGIHGLRLLPPHTLAPLESTSYGIGQALQQLILRYGKAVDYIVSVGGSASIDAGMGCLQALGWELLAGDGVRLPEPIGGGHLSQIRLLRPPAQNPLTGVRLMVITDVTTGFCDAPAVFGPQKGANEEEIEQLTAAFHALASFVPENAQRPGSGAAGGLPFGLAIAQPDLTLTLGGDWMYQYTHLEGALIWADGVITGEGGLDDTSWMGKATGVLIDHAIALQKPVWVACGQCRLSDARREQLAQHQVRILPLTPHAQEKVAVTPDPHHARIQLKTVLAAV